MLHFNLQRRLKLIRYLYPQNCGVGNFWQPNCFCQNTILQIFHPNCMYFSSFCGISLCHKPSCQFEICRFSPVARSFPPLNHRWPSMKFWMTCSQLFPLVARYSVPEISELLLSWRDTKKLSEFTFNESSGAANVSLCFYMFLRSSPSIYETPISILFLFCVFRAVPTWVSGFVYNLFHLFVLHLIVYQ